jgi:thiol-disulfide isomerase/thioredoxin
MPILSLMVSLSGLRGKVVLIDFWATWCPPCLKQLPFIKKYYNEFKDMNFAVVGAAEETDIGKLNAFLQTNDIAWPTIANDAGRYDELAALYAVKNIPASFLIDKKGILRHVNLTENELRNAIVELINE